MPLLISSTLEVDDTFRMNVEGRFHRVALLVVNWTDVWVNKTIRRSEMSRNNATMRPISDRPVDENRVHHSVDNVAEWSIWHYKADLCRFGPAGGH